MTWDFGDSVTGAVTGSLSATSDVMTLVVKEYENGVFLGGGPVTLEKQ
jgi:hypothetical protein